MLVFRRICFIGSCLISFFFCLLRIIEGGIEKKYFFFIFFIVMLGCLLKVCSKMFLVLNFFKVVIVGLFVDFECIFNGKLYFVVSFIWVFSMVFWVFLCLVLGVIWGWKFKFIFFIVYILWVCFFIFEIVILKLCRVMYFLMLFVFFCIGWMFK